jgi:hypothetical protein
MAANMSKKCSLSSDHKATSNGVFAEVIVNEFYGKPHRYSNDVLGQPHHRTDRFASHDNPPTRVMALILRMDPYKLQLYRTKDANKVSFHPSGGLLAVEWLD